MSNLKNEFARLKSEALAFVNKATTSNRSLTLAEKAEVDTRFARMNEIKATLDSARELEALECDSVSDALKALNTSKGASSQAEVFNKPLKSDESLFNKLGFSKASMGLGDFFRAAVLGPQNDYERFALQAGSDSTGGFELPTDTAARFIDSLRGQSVLMTAGATVLPLADRWKASQIVDPTATFRAESASVTTASPFTGVSLSPKTLSVIVKVSREQLEDSINVNAEIERTLAQAMSLAADAACAFGATDGPTGLVSTSGILSVASAANGDTITSYSKLLSALYSLQSNNTTPTAFVMHPRTSQAFNALADTTGQPLRMPDSLQSVKQLASSSVPITQTQGTSSVATTIIGGDFSRLLIGMRVGLRIEVLKEIYAGTFETGFQASIRLDSIATRAKSFVKVTGLIP